MSTATAPDPKTLRQVATRVLWLSTAIRCLGVRDFGQSSSLPDAYRLHGLDTAAIVDAALSVLGR